MTTDQPRRPWAEVTTRRPGKGSASDKAAGPVYAWEFATQEVSFAESGTSIALADTRDHLQASREVPKQRVELVQIGKPNRQPAHAVIDRRCWMRGSTRRRGAALTSGHLQQQPLEGLRRMPGELHGAAAPWPRDDAHLGPEHLAQPASQRQHVSVFHGPRASDAPEQPRHGPSVGEDISGQAFALSGSDAGEGLQMPELELSTRSVRQLEQVRVVAEYRYGSRQLRLLRRAAHHQAHLGQRHATLVQGTDAGGKVSQLCPAVQSPNRIPGGGCWWVHLEDRHQCMGRDPKLAIQFRGPNEQLRRDLLVYHQHLGPMGVWVAAAQIVPPNGGRGQLKAGQGRASGKSGHSWSIPTMAAATRPHPRVSGRPGLARWSAHPMPPVAGRQQQRLIARLQDPTLSSPADHVGVPPESPMASQPATQAQLDYIQRLCRKLGLSHDQAAAAGVSDAPSIDAASATIDRLKAQLDAKTAAEEGTAGKLAVQPRGLRAADLRRIAVGEEAAPDQMSEDDHWILHRLAKLADLELALQQPARWAGANAGGPILVEHLVAYFGSIELVAQMFRVTVATVRSGWGGVLPANRAHEAAWLTRGYVQPPA